MRVIEKIEVIRIKGKRFEVCAISYSRKETREYKSAKRELNQLFKKG